MPQHPKRVSITSDRLPILIEPNHEFSELIR
ncbi:hypothetical protein SAMN04489752_1485 [Brevibacterium siliguriense]|uniref:Uncharacterized protein n=1 Tax=Brevibacterium siliguriense TaxID=1136497 RepID=A0A1H1RCN7_9MICO|nr:hypothetical protein SAMN04489752_1485 [Brevibacterium siliguriense]